MASFNDFINHNNKVSHRDCVEYVITQPIGHFAREVRCPLIIGKDIFVGDFSKKTNRGIPATFRFKATEEPSESNKSPMNAVYAIRKKELNEGVLITVGRTSESDIPLNDYAISKQHAAFVKKANRYFITDLGSTNGVMVNDKKVSPKEFAPLQTRSNVVIGRFSFLFAHPIYFYCMVYAKHLSMFPAKEDLMQIAERVDIKDLMRIAKQNRYDYGENPANYRQQIINHMDTKLSRVDVLHWLSGLPCGL